MKKIKALLAVILILSIGFSLLACGKKVNLQTEEDAIEYLKDYVEDKDRWGYIANEIGLSSSAKKNSEFGATAFAQKEDGEWLVVLHGFISEHPFSYVALVSTVGNVTEQFVADTCISGISKG